MKKSFVLIAILITSMTLCYAQPGAELPKEAKAKMKTEEFVYTADGIKMKGYVAYIPNERSKLPVVLVVPEWWGMTEYPKMRARKLAELGYFAMVVDMYGDGKEAKNPDEAKKLSGKFYEDPQLGNKRISAAKQKAETFTQVDKKRIAAIGYCFGGAMVLDAAKSGMDLKGVVSFHGGLEGVHAVRGQVKSKILVCHGGADKFISVDEIKAFRADLDSAGVRYGFKVYPDALHAFTNPDATALGKKFDLPIAYNEAADKASWEDMKRFLREAFYVK